MTTKYIRETCGTCGQSRRVVSGRWLRERREAYTVSLRDMARRLKLSAAYLSDVELNRRRATDKIIASYRRILSWSDETED